jgi:hypothetical protein
MEVRIQGNTLDTSRRALFFDIEDAEKEMRKWTEHGRRNLVCYIIRQLPREAEYRDEFEITKYDSSNEEIEDNALVEHVYQYSAYKRKLTFKEGDMVEYIFYDGETQTLKKGRVAKAPADETNYIIIEDQHSEQDAKTVYVRVPSRYVFQLKHF